MEAASHEKASLLYHWIQISETAQKAKEKIDPIDMVVKTPSDPLQQSNIKQILEA